MKIIVTNSARELGLHAAKLASEYLGALVKKYGYARIVVSTGASQFETFEALIASDIDWSKIEMFHLDEYEGLPETHPASFSKYLKERFVSRVNLLAANFVDGATEGIAMISEKLLERPVDLGLIGIGENGHIAFNDPPADFQAKDPYILVTLNDTCKAQQVREGWFADSGEVPQRAVSMSVSQILKCKKILSCVPHAVKAQAVADTLNSPLTETVPATALKNHPDWTLLLDKNSAALIS